MAAMASLCPTRQISSRPSIYEVAVSILHPKQHTCPFRPIHRRQPFAHRALHTTRPKRSSSSSSPSRAPRSHDRGPASSETTQTDFSNLDVLGRTPVPSTSIDACLWDGFHLNNGVKITQGAGVLLVGGEAFGWRPWEAGKAMRLLNAKGQWEVDDAVWGLLDVVWPKPDLLILGVGPSMAPVSPATRKYINSLGIQIDIQDTRNASAQFNLLATERGVGSVAAALVPLGWREGVGVK